jgi:hypothetical protein
MGCGGGAEHWLEGTPGLYPAQSTDGTHNRQGSGKSRPAAKPAGRGPGASEHLHPGLGPEHDLLIGGQDQGLGLRQVVRLSADVPLAIEEQHPQQLAGGNRFAEAGGYEQVHRDDADRAGADQGSGAHGWAGERHRR